MDSLLRPRAPVPRMAQHPAAPPVNQFKACDLTSLSSLSSRKPSYVLDVLVFSRSPAVISLSTGCTHYHPSRIAAVHDDAINLSCWCCNIASPSLLLLCNHQAGASLSAQSPCVCTSAPSCTQRLLTSYHLLDMYLQLF